MKWFKRLICIVTLCLGGAELSPTFGSSVDSEGVYRVDLGVVTAHVYPVKPAVEEYGYSASTTDSGERIYWENIDCSVVAINRDLWVNDIHYTIPDKFDHVWIIEGCVIVPQFGRVKPSQASDEITNESKDGQEDFTKEVMGIRFEIKRCKYSQAGKIKDDRNFYMVWGELFLSVKQGRLWFRGTDYGQIDKGDVVTIDAARKLTVKKMIKQK